MNPRSFLHRRCTAQFLPMLLFFVCLACPAWVLAQTTAFNLSGRLSEVGLPVNGLYDFRFTVFGSPDLNDVVAGPLARSQMGVKGGVFNARLDFGNQTFTGADRWLQVEVRRTGTSTYTNLSPRIEITASPYAMRARSAATADSLSSGGVVTSVNGLADNITLAAGANVTITPNGNTLTISSAGGGGGDSPWLVAGPDTYYNSGRVGIGTAAPQAILDVHGGATDSSALFVRSDPSTFGRGGIIHHQSATYAWQELAQTTGSATDGFLTFNYVNRTAPATKISSNVLTLRANGRVGIGTVLPTSKLEIVGAQDALKIHGHQPVMTWIDASAADARSAIQSVGGGLNLFSQNYLNGVNPFGYMRLDGGGNVGIGTAMPATRLDVAGDITGTRLVLRGDPSAPANATLLAGDAGVTTLVPFSPSSGRPLNLLVRDATVRQLTITGGADLAEPFQMSHDGIARGSVVVIDDANPGQLKLSTRAYDKRVAGIVSGANGVQPGISLHQEGLLEGGQNVALSGRVYVQADASFGAIRPGDLLTTSDTPGHAMRVGDHAQAQGAILGKAMSALEKDRGMVLVLVTLQ
jgi:hypothetical protein